MPKCDLVAEGGGAKGIGLIGAVAALEKAGFTFSHFAGTSAGAIVTALIAVGYSSDELHSMVRGTHYQQFKDGNAPLINFALKWGFYPGKYPAAWIDNLLLAKGVKTFGDLRTDDPLPRYRYKLQVIASDVTRGKMLVLPRDIADYGEDPDKLKVCDAIRMSIGIPDFYEPIVRYYGSTKCLIVDGGLNSNYPIWLLDDGTADPPWPTFGLRVNQSSLIQPHIINNVLDYQHALIDSLLEARDNQYIGAHAAARTIFVPSLGVTTTNFNIGTEQIDKLYQSGLDAGQKFLSTFNFQEYKAKFRS